MVEVEGVDVRIGERQLLRGASFALERGEHVALVGPNGSGKTTLLETLLGRREAAKGKIQLGHGVLPAYFSQQEAELDMRGSVLQCVQTMTNLARPDAMSLLGRFLFSGWDEVEKPVSVLSGGERRRLALAVTVASGANFLVLDEPTNHLDLESREALEAALDAFPSASLLVLPRPAPCSTPGSRSGRSRSRAWSCTPTTGLGGDAAAARGAPRGRERPSRKPKQEERPSLGRSMWRSRGRASSSAWRPRSRRGRRRWRSSR